MIIASIVTVVSRRRVLIIIFSIHSKSEKINFKNEINTYRINL